MLRQALLNKGISLNNAEFAAVLQMTTEDIKFNRIGFKKRTSMAEVISIAEKSAKALKRCLN